MQQSWVVTPTPLPHADARPDPEDRAVGGVPAGSRRTPGAGTWGPHRTSLPTHTVSNLLPRDHQGRKDSLPEEADADQRGQGRLKKEHRTPLEGGRGTQERELGRPDMETVHSPRSLIKGNTDTSNSI